jgi:hypothetical protein
MFTSPATIDTLKAHVDEAIGNKQWDCKSVFDTPPAFVMTGKFVRFLDENNHFECVDRIECAVLVALAVIAEEWPPPKEVIKEILALLRARIPNVRQQPRRAPEIVVAYVLGWPRPDLNRSGPRWIPALKEAEWLLRAQMKLATGSCLEWFVDNVARFVDADPTNWAQPIFNLFTAAHFELRCHCFLRGLAPGISFTEFTNPRGNTKARAKTCFHRHHLSVWDPVEMPLWHFAARAVKGTNGTFKSRWGEIPSGMLYDALWHSDKRVVIVNVADRECPHCSKQSIYLSCEACGLDLPTDPQPFRVAAKRWFILEQGGVTPKASWTCQRCGNIYPALHCGGLVCGPTHDLCPVCSTTHPVGSQRQTRQVYFLEHSSVDVPIDDHLQQRLAVPAPGTSFQELLTNATTRALDDLGQKLWVQKLLSLLEEKEGFVRWIGLLQPDGEVDWPELWEELSDAPDLPATPELLREEYEREIKQQLIEIFKFTFGLADLDWTSINNHRPTLTRTQRREGEL